MNLNMPPMPQGGTILQAAPPPSRVADIVDTRQLRPEGKTWFFASDDKKWATFAERSLVFGCSLLECRNISASGVLFWAPLAGARVVLRTEEGEALFDCCTRGDGTTLRIPDLFAPIVAPDVRWRVEVESEVDTRNQVRCVLHRVK